MSSQIFHKSKELVFPHIKELILTLPETLAVHSCVSWGGKQADYNSCTQNLFSLCCRKGRNNLCLSYTWLNKIAQKCITEPVLVFITQFYPFLSLFLISVSTCIHAEVMVSEWLLFLHQAACVASSRCWGERRCMQSVASFSRWKRWTWNVSELEVTKEPEAQVWEERNLLA